MNSDDAKKIVELIAEKDISKLRNYESLVFNTFYVALQELNKYNEDELKLIRDAFKVCTGLGLKIETISRHRRTLTGITKGVKGKYYDKYEYQRALEKEKEKLTELGY